MKSSVKLAIPAVALVVIIPVAVVAVERRSASPHKLAFVMIVTSMAPIKPVTGLPNLSFT